MLQNKNLARRDWNKTPSPEWRVTYNVTKQKSRPTRLKLHTNNVVGYPPERYKTKISPDEIETTHPVQRINVSHQVTKQKSRPTRLKLIPCHMHSFFLVCLVTKQKSRPTRLKRRLQLRSCVHSCRLLQNKNLARRDWNMTISFSSSNSCVLQNKNLARRDWNSTIAGISVHCPSVTKQKSRPTRLKPCERLYTPRGSRIPVLQNKNLARRDWNEETARFLACTGLRYKTKISPDEIETLALYRTIWCKAEASYKTKISPDEIETI